MKRSSLIIISSLFVIAALLDYLTCQGVVEKEKLFINYYENGQLKQKRYFPKGLEFKIKKSPELENLHKIILRGYEGVLINSYLLTSETGEQKYEVWDGLKGGNYMLQILDNFGELYTKPIKIQISQTLTYDDLMEMFYSSSKGIATDEFDNSTILKINVTEDNLSTNGFNAKVYRDSKNALMLDLIYKSKEDKKLTIINTFRCKEELIDILTRKEKMLAFNTENAKVGKYAIIEYIVNSRQVYSVPVADDSSISQELIKTIYKFSYENTAREIKLY